jgi:transcription factor Ssl1
VLNSAYSLVGHIVYSDARKQASSASLAKTYHHLFPVPTFTEVPSIAPAVSTASSVAFASSSKASSTSGRKRKGKLMKDENEDAPMTEVEQSASAVGATTRMHTCFACLDSIDATTALLVQCPSCQRQFCFECDEFVHQQLHNCPGCQSIDAPVEH